MRERIIRIHVCVHEHPEDVQWTGKVADVRGPELFVCVTAGNDRNARSIV
jgi:hypothetical protein